MFSDYQAPGREPREPYVYQPNKYPFSHIHATNTAAAAPNAKPAERVRLHKKKLVSAHEIAADPTFVRPQTGPVKHQILGHGPFHSTSLRPDQKRFDFSKPKVASSRPLSVLDERAHRDALNAELPPQDTIRLFTSKQRHILEAAVMARAYRESAPTYVQSENNDPLSNHSNLILERFANPAGGEGGAGGQDLLNSASQPEVSAHYIQQQTQLRLASKARQLEQYHASVQQRLNQRVAKEKQKEAARKAQLPSSVKHLVYNMHTPQTETPVSEQQQQQQEQQQGNDASSAPLGLARMDLLPYHESMAPPPAVVQAWAHQPPDVAPRQQEARPFGTESTRNRAAELAGSQTAREKRVALMSKKEQAEYRLLVRKQEIERERQLAHQARMNPSFSASTLSSQGRPRERVVAFGAALSRTPSPACSSPPRPTAAAARGAIGAADERDDRYRNPRSFVVRQHTAEDEEEQDEAVLHVPLAAAAARTKKSRMSAAVAGRKLPKKKATARGEAEDGKGVAEKNSAYRRLLLERLHSVALTLQHPLPPLCACGFTPAEEYELLFSYQGVAPGSALAHVHQQTSAAATAAAAQQGQSGGQQPFNLSTLIAAAPNAPSIHHHSHAHAQQAAAQAAATTLPSHVAVDSTRHAFAHKHNCAYYNNSEAYIKALANLLHTFEDQQQI